MKRLLLILLGTMVSTVALANKKWDAQDITDCMHKNLVDEGALRQLEVTTTGRAGEQSSIKSNIYWKPSSQGARVTLQVTKPDDLAGSAYLLREKRRTDDEVYVYVPAAGKARKITGAARSENLWGTAFSYEEIKLIHGLALADATQRHADAVVKGRPVFVLESNLESVKRDLRKVVTYVDQKSCTVLKGEVFNEAGRLTKVLEGDVSMLFETSDYGNRPIWMMLSYTMKDIERGSQSVATLGEISLLEKVASPVFEPESFHKKP
jgi:hypothetical protein